MNRIVIDTNIVISFLTDRNLQQQELAAKLFADALARKHELVLHQIVVTEVVYVLLNFYRRTVKETSSIVRDLIGFPGIIVIDKMPWTELFDLWPHVIDSYADASIVAVMRSAGYEYLATFDRTLCNRLKTLGATPYAFAHGD